MLNLIENHFKDNRQKLVKKMTFRAGSPEAGEDVVQTAYERAIRYRRSCDPERFNQWFSMLLNNALRDYKNAEKGFIYVELDDEDQETMECPSYPESIMREIFELIDTKSADQIEVLTLYFKQGYSALDITHITEFPYKRNHQIIQRFRNELKDLYRE